MLRFLLPLALLAAAGCSSSPSEQVERRGAPGEAIVELDYIKSKPPDEWKEFTPKSNAMSPVIYDFRLPGTGKEDDAELHIFRGIRGSAEDNVARWKGQFVEPPAGKKPEEAATVTHLKIGGFPATVLDIRGTHLKKEPRDPSDKGTRLPNHRMVAIHFEGPRDVYQIRLRGPDRTVEEYKAGFDAWLAAFE